MDDTDDGTGEGPTSSTDSRTERVTTDSDSDALVLTFDDKWWPGGGPLHLIQNRRTDENAATG